MTETKAIATVDLGEGFLEETKPGRMISVSDQTQDALDKLEERVATAKRRATILIKLTSPGQWTVFDGGNGKETVYATAGAADRILRQGLGLRWGPWDYKVLHGEKETECWASADLIEQNGQVYERFTGRRAIGGFVKNERDLIKGAIQNCKHTAVTDIMGFRFMSKADFKELGLDLDKLERRAEFQTYDAQPDSIVVPFGKDKGKPISEVSDSNLKWLAEAVKKSVADPEKARFADKNQKLLDALREEYKKRNGGAKEETKEPLVDEPPAEDEHNYGPPPVADDDPLAYGLK